METENKIIKYFIKNKKHKTIRALSTLIKSDYKITHTAVQKLIDKHILLCENIGKSSLCVLNSTYYGPEIYKAENDRKEYIIKNSMIRSIYKEVAAKLGTSFFIFIIFGSYAKGTQVKSSDIDLMLISNNKKAEERVSEILSLIPAKTHVLVFTEEEFVRMKDSKKANVVHEAMENNIILYGIEPYYKLKNT